MCRLTHCHNYLVILLFFSILIPSNCTNVDGNVSTAGNIGPSVVNVAALFASNSTIGRVAKLAIELAVKDVNSNETLLNGTKLVINLMDSNCNAFVGTTEALSLLRDNKDKFGLVISDFYMPAWMDLSCCNL